MWAELKIRKSEKKSELWNICSQLWEKVLIVKCYLKIADVKLYLKEIKSKMCYKSELQDKTCTSEKKVVYDLGKIFWHLTLQFWQSSHTWV